MAGPRRQCAVSGACRQPAGADRVRGGLESCTRPAMHRPQRRRKWVKGGTSGPVDPPLGGGQEEPPSKVRHTGCTCPPVKVWWCTPPHFSCTPCQQPRLVRISAVEPSGSMQAFSNREVGAPPITQPYDHKRGHEHLNLFSRARQATRSCTKSCRSRRRRAGRPVSPQKHTPGRHPAAASAQDTIQVRHCQGLHPPVDSRTDIVCPARVRHREYLAIVPDHII